MYPQAKNFKFFIARNRAREAPAQSKDLEIGRPPSKMN